MPLTLNTSHPLYSNIIAFICVDDDNVVKDLKGDTCTTDAAVVIGTGAYGRHFQTQIVSNNAKGIALTNGHLTKPVANPVGTSMIVINAGNSRSSRGSVTNTPNGAVNSIGVYTGDAAGCQTSNNFPVALGTTDVIGTGAYCIAAAWNGTTEYKTWVNGNQEAVVSGNLGNATDTGKTLYIGGANTGGFGGFAADYVYYIHFRKYLSEAELDEIYASLGANNQISLLASAGSPPAGTFTVGTITTTQTTASVPYTYSAADQTGIEYRIDGGAAVTASASPQSLTGLTAGTTYGIEFRAANTFGNGAWSTSAPFTAASVPVGTITITDLANNIDTPWTSAAVDAATIMPLSLGSVVVNKTGLSTTAGADLVITDATISTGTEYIIILKIGTAYGWYRAVAT